MIAGNTAHVLFLLGYDQKKQEMLKEMMLLGDSIGHLKEELHAHEAHLVLVEIRGELFEGTL